MLVIKRFYLIFSKIFNFFKNEYYLLQNDYLDLNDRYSLNIERLKVVIIYRFRFHLKQIEAS